MTPTLRDLGRARGHADPEPDVVALSRDEAEIARRALECLEGEASLDDDEAALLARLTEALAR